MSVLADRSFVFIHAIEGQHQFDDRSFFILRDAEHPTLTATWLGKEMISLSPPPRRTGRAGHLAPGSSNLRTPKGALML